MTSIVRESLLHFTAFFFQQPQPSSAARHTSSRRATLDIGHPWSRPTPKDANIAGGYLTITNKGKVADRLIGGALARGKPIEVHEMAMWTA